MSPAEVAHRVFDRAQIALWRRLWFNPKKAPKPQLRAREPQFNSGLARQPSIVPAEAATPIVRCAAELLRGYWRVFAIERTDVKAGVDWHWDASASGRVAPDTYAFDIRINGEDLPFDTKYLWELSRHHQTTVLATAYWLTGEEVYARDAADQVRRWCDANPFLHGIHWASGIELGIRMISFVWTRRLLDSWKEVRNAFEFDRGFVEQVYWHSWLLSRRVSYGSSANNHLIYEAAGLYVASCAMPWFMESKRWREQSRKILEREFVRQTFDSGLNREQASDYHGFVLEALFCCIMEGDQSGHPLSDAAWDVARRMIERLADLADCKGQPPRQGDSDSAHGLLLDAPGYDRWADLLELGRICFGRSDWWPTPLAQTARAQIFSLVLNGHRKASREFVPRRRTSMAKDAGVAILRMRSNTADEIYCAFDAGPLGYLSIAAHGHADALAVELRLGGQPVLVDPGTYTYAKSRAWRRYFRSTLAHNTVELDGRSQSAEGGPFLWTSYARAKLLNASGLDEDSDVAVVVGEHDGYLKNRFKGRHRRRVSLDRHKRSLQIEDDIASERTVMCRILFHLHPDIRCSLDGAKAVLVSDSLDQQMAVMLPTEFAWQLIRGNEDPPLGWYSPSYDLKVPTSVLVGSKSIFGTIKAKTKIEFMA
jgi:hypothetical protein